LAKGLPKSSIHSLTICRRLRNRYFVLELLGLHETGGFTPTGDLVRLDHEEMRSQGRKVVLKYLKQGNKTLKKSHYIKVSQAYLKFLRDHEHVSVDLTKEQKLRLTPLRWLRGGRFIGEPGCVKVLPTAISCSAFYLALQSAFEDAT